jgi:hypothetical protein
MFCWGTRLVGIRSCEVKPRRYYAARLLSISFLEMPPLVVSLLRRILLSAFATVSQRRDFLRTNKASSTACNTPRMDLKQFRHSGVSANHSHLIQEHSGVGTNHSGFA